MFQPAGRRTRIPSRPSSTPPTIVDSRVGFKLSGKVGKKDTLASIRPDESPSSGPLFVPGTGNTPGLPSFARSGPSRATATWAHSVRAGEYGGGSNLVAGADGQLRLTKASQLSFHGFGP